MDEQKPLWTHAPAGPGRPQGPPSRRQIVLAWAAVAVVLVLIAAGVVGWLLVRHLNGNIRTADAGTSSTTVDGTQDILLVGSDNRSGADAKYGSSEGARSDTTILFHTPADRRDATAVSIPRDSMVWIPECAKADGTVVPANYGMFNSAFDEGGIACTVKTVQALTGIAITHFVVLDFTGFAATVNALGGVKVCTSEAIDDQDSGLNIPAGVNMLNGDQALAFVRVRHIGDGSDLERIERQQYFMHEFSGQIRATGLLSDPLRLYRVLNDATKSIVTDPGLGSLSDLYALAQTLNKIPSSAVSYQTVPVAPYPEDNNRVIWQEPDASTLWQSLLTEPAQAGAASTSAGAPATSASPGSGAGAAQTQAAATAGADSGSGAASGTPGATATATATATASNSTDPQGLYTCPVS